MLVGILVLPLFGDGEQLPPGVLPHDKADLAPRAAEASPATSSTENIGDRDAAHRSIAVVEAIATKAGEVPRAPRGHLLVRVVDDATGEPIAGAEVAASLERDEPVPAAELRLQRAIADPFERLRAGGQSATTDDRGYAVLRGSHWMQVMARHGALSVRASLELAMVGPAGYLLRLRPAHTTEVLVMDALRRPLADVPLGLLVGTSSAGSWSIDGRDQGIGSTDANGRLRVQLDSHLLGHERAADLVVFVAAPGLTGARCPIDATREHIEITMPAFGSVVLQVVASDGTIPGDDPSWMAYLASEAESSNQSHRLDDEVWGHGFGGEVRFPYVGLGVDLLASAWIRGLYQQEQLAGPRRQDESILHRLTLPTMSGAHLRARLLDENGKPWANTWVLAERRGRSLWDSVARTDGDGRVQMRIATGNDGAPVRLRGRQGDGPLASEHELYLTPNVLHDAGDLVLRRGDRIARVTVIEERPAPPDFHLRVQHANNGDWEHSHHIRVERIDDTHFAIYGAPAAAAQRLRLCVQAPGCEAITPIEFGRGAELTVHLRQGLALVARILVGPEMRMAIEDDECVLRLTNDLGDYGRVSGRIQGDEWLVEFHGARPGRYRLTVECNTTLATLEDVLVAAGSPPDPRLTPWDLRDVVQPLQVLCVDTNALPVPAEADLLLQTEGGDWDWIGWTRGGRCLALLPRRPLGLLLQFEEGGFARATNAQDTVQVVAPIPTPITITLQGMPELLPDAPIEVEVMVAESELRARGLPDVRLLGPVTWRRQQHTLSFDLFAPASGSVRFLRLGPDGPSELLEQLPCALSPGEPIVLTVPDTLRERLRQWTPQR